MMYFPLYDVSLFLFSMCRCSKNQTFDIRRNPCTYANWIRNHTGFTADLHGQGGMGSVVDSLVKAVEKHGGEVCTKLRVDEVPLHIAPDIFVKDEGVVYTCISTYIVWERLAETSLVILLLLVFWCLTNTHPERKCMQDIILLRVCPWMRQEWTLGQIDSRFEWICHKFPPVTGASYLQHLTIVDQLWSDSSRCFFGSQPDPFWVPWPFVIREVLLEGSTAVGIRCQGNPNRLREIQNKPFWLWHFKLPEMFKMLGGYMYWLSFPISQLWMKIVL